MFPVRLANRRPRMPTRTFTAVLEKEGDLYVALCPELDVASQGATVEEAIANLQEAVATTCSGILCRRSRSQ